MLTSSGATGNIATEICSWGMEDINPDAFLEIKAFGHRVVNTKVFGRNLLEVYTRCSPSLPDNIPIDKKNEHQVQLCYKS
nr:hypothetical protein [Endozoicomonas sp.]